MSPLFAHRSVVPLPCCLPPAGGALAGLPAGAQGPGWLHVPAQVAAGGGAQGALRPEGQPSRAVEVCSGGVALQDGCPTTHTSCGAAPLACRRTCPRRSASSRGPFQRRSCALWQTPCAASRPRQPTATPPCCSWPRRRRRPSRGRTRVGAEGGACGWWGGMPELAGLLGAMTAAHSKRATQSPSASQPASACLPPCLQSGLRRCSARSASCCLPALSQQRPPPHTWQTSASWRRAALARRSRR